MSVALPIESVLPALRDALSTSSAVLLLAEPGAGKTTGVPLALMDAPWLAGRGIVMLEPRRLAARAAAHRMAETLGETVGERVGYRVRLDSRVSARTRIEVVTEGLLTRRLQSDPELAGVGLLIFDEFHERSLDGDLALALARDIQEGLRPDLKLLVMSATLDAPPLARLLGGAPVIAAPGRTFPVETHHRPRAKAVDLEADMVRLIRAALRETEGGILAFLPGEAEIRRTAAQLEGGALPPTIDLYLLFGAMPTDAQDRAIRPAPPGRRKIVLATTIAESSLTLDGIATVIDSGLKRAPRFDPRTGMTRLETVRVSLASAEQRRGRAGRQGPGVCYRLWSEAEARAFAAQDAPEIAQADLAPFALELAQWGVADPAHLTFLDAPPEGAWRRAVQLLKDLDALDTAGAITATGRAMAQLPLHPRLAHMVAAGARRGEGGLACDLAAILSERDILTGPREADLALRVEMIRTESRATVRVRAAARQLRHLARVPRDDHGGAIGALVAEAYPDRIAQRRGGPGRFRLSGGGGAFLAESDPLAAEEFLAIAETDGNPTDARIFLATPIARAEIETLFGAHIVDEEDVTYDRKMEAVTAKKRRCLGALVLEEKPFLKPDPARAATAMLDGIRATGIDILPWTDETRSLRARLMFLRRTLPEEELPDLSDAALLARIEDWLAPYLTGITRRAELATLDLEAALLASVSPGIGRDLDRLAPARFTIPSGAGIAIDYGTGDVPVLRARLQELFGLLETPRIGGGRVPLRIELLSPAGRPVAVSQDLASFWRQGYKDVRTDLRGRYPKHLWPEDPLTAQAPRPGKTR